MSVQNIGRNKWRVIVKTGGYRYSTNKNGVEVRKPIEVSRIFNGSKDEAREFEWRLEQEQKGGGRTRISLDKSFSNYVEKDWLPSLEVSGKTKKDYVYAINLLLPALGDVPLSDLTAYDIEQAIHDLPAGDARERSKRILRIALNAAVRWEFISSSPLDKAKITIGKGNRRRHVPYDATEREAVREAFRGKPGEAVILIMSECGLGKEEALGLDWEDLVLSPDPSLVPPVIEDPKNLGLIYVHKAWGDSGDDIEELTTKNEHRNRIVYVSGPVLERLRQIKEGKEGPIWPGKDRLRVSPHTAISSFRRRVEAAGIRYIPINNLRHTYATIAITSGVPISVVSDGLGHSQESTTVNKYLRTSDAARMEAAVRFGRLSGNGQSGDEAAADATDGPPLAAESA